MILRRNWQEKLLVPVLVNLTTASLLFATSLVFRPVRQWLFPPERTLEYPLICTAEPYVTDSGEKLTVDFFIINRTGEEYIREQLVQFLKTQNPDPQSSPSPDIRLNYYRKVGNIESATADTEFNDDKGDLRVSLDKVSNQIQIIVRKIQLRAVLKVNIVVAGLPDVRGVNRMTKQQIPFHYEAYQDACYSPTQPRP